MGYHVNMEPDDNDTLLVTCPDLPEVVTFGDDEADALLHAADAIETALQGRINQREAIPDPSYAGGFDVPLPALVEAKLALYRAFLDSGVTKAELARRLDWHPPSVDRLFVLGHDSRLSQLAAAAGAIGKTLHVTVAEAA